MTDRPIINLAKARELLAAAVETQGRDFVYNQQGPEGLGSCYYEPVPVDGYTPETDPRTKTGCGVGEALGLHGVKLRPFESLGAQALNQHYPGIMTDAAGFYFRAFQILQDKGLTWGEALDAAEARVADGSLLIHSDAA